MANIAQHRLKLELKLKKKKYTFSSPSKIIIQLTLVFDKRLRKHSRLILKLAY